MCSMTVEMPQRRDRQSDSGKNQEKRVRSEVESRPALSVVGWRWCRCVVIMRNEGNSEAVTARFSAVGLFSFGGASTSAESRALKARGRGRASERPSAQLDIDSPKGAGTRE